MPQFEDAQAQRAQARFIRQSMAEPLLSREREYRLARSWREDGDEDSLQELIRAYTRLVVSLATKFRNYGLPMSDLIQEGHVGLLEAAARFEPEREVRFSTYATWWIRASMQDYILRNWSIVRGGTSSAQKALFFNLRRLRARLAQTGIGASGPSMYRQISDALGVSEKDVALMDSRLSGPDTSLSAPVSDEDGGAARMDFLIDERPLQDEIVEGLIDDKRRSDWLREAMDILNTRERRIIMQRRLTEEGATLESLGNELGISKERVRQIENRALEKLRGALVRGNPDMAATRYA